jgi:hypothetical protein
VKCACGAHGCAQLMKGLCGPVKEGQVFESAVASPEASTVANGNGVAVSSPVSPTPAAGGPFLDAKEKVGLFLCL